MQNETPYEGLQKLPLRIAKAELLERFERHYVTQLLEQTGGNVAEAARRRAASIASRSFGRFAAMVSRARAPDAWSAVIRGGVRLLMTAALVGATLLASGCPAREQQS